ncbi:YadA-like family protein [Mycetohabitans sp. B46]|uniref:YadA-like family protein n=1 Tax=Mycetohabitans sp. B46 TaxID=2772536 RepID=UPI00307E28D3
MLGVVTALLISDDARSATVQSDTQDTPMGEVASHNEGSSPLKARKTRWDVKPSDKQARLIDKVAPLDKGSSQPKERKTRWDVKPPDMQDDMSIDEGVPHDKGSSQPKERKKRWDVKPPDMQDDMSIDEGVPLDKGSSQPKARKKRWDVKPPDMQDDMSIDEGVPLDKGSSQPKERKKRWDVKPPDMQDDMSIDEGAPLDKGSSQPKERKTRWDVKPPDMQDDMSIDEGVPHDKGSSQPKERKTRWDVKPSDKQDMLVDKVAPHGEGAMPSKVRETSRWDVKPSDKQARLIDKVAPLDKGSSQPKERKTRWDVKPPDMQDDMSIDEGAPHDKGSSQPKERKTRWDVKPPDMQDDMSIDEVAPHDKGSSQPKERKTRWDVKPSDKQDMLVDKVAPHGKGAMPSKVRETSRWDVKPSDKQNTPINKGALHDKGSGQPKERKTRWDVKPSDKQDTLIDKVAPLDKGPSQPKERKKRWDVKPSDMQDKLAPKRKQRPGVTDGKPTEVGVRREKRMRERSQSVPIFLPSESLPNEANHFSKRIRQADESLFVLAPRKGRGESGDSRKDTANQIDTGRLHPPLTGKDYTDGGIAPLPNVQGANRIRQRSRSLSALSPELEQRHLQVDTPLFILSPSPDGGDGDWDSLQQIRAPEPAWPQSAFSDVPPTNTHDMLIDETASHDQGSSQPKVQQSRLDVKLSTPVSDTQNTLVSKGKWKQQRDVTPGTPMEVGVQRKKRMRERSHSVPIFLPSESLPSEADRFSKRIRQADESLFVIASQKGGGKSGDSQKGAADQIDTGRLRPSLKQPQFGDVTGKANTDSGIALVPSKGANRTRQRSRSLPVLSPGLEQRRLQVDTPLFVLSPSPDGGDGNLDGLQQIRAPEPAWSQSAVSDVPPTGAALTYESTVAVPFRTTFSILPSIRPGQTVTSVTAATPTADSGIDSNVVGSEAVVLCDAGGNTHTSILGASESIPENGTRADTAMVIPSNSRSKEQRTLTESDGVKPYDVDKYDDEWQSDSAPSTETKVAQAGEPSKPPVRQERQTGHHASATMSAAHPASRRGSVSTMSDAGISVDGRSTQSAGESSDQLLTQTLEANSSSALQQTTADKVLDALPGNRGRSKSAVLSRPQVAKRLRSSSEDRLRSGGLDAAGLEHGIWQSGPAPSKEMKVAQVGETPAPQVSETPGQRERPIDHDASATMSAAHPASRRGSASTASDAGTSLDGRSIQSAGESSNQLLTQILEATSPTLQQTAADKMLDALPGNRGRSKSAVLSQPQVAKRLRSSSEDRLRSGGLDAAGLEHGIWQSGPAPSKEMKVAQVSEAPAPQVSEALAQQEWPTGYDASATMSAAHSASRRGSASTTSDAGISVDGRSTQSAGESSNQLLAQTLEANSSSALQQTAADKVLDASLGNRGRSKSAVLSRPQVAKRLRSSSEDRLRSGGLEAAGLEHGIWQSGPAPSKEMKVAQVSEAPAPQVSEALAQQEWPTGYDASATMSAAHPASRRGSASTTSTINNIMADERERTLPLSPTESAGASRSPNSDPSSAVEQKPSGMESAVMTLTTAILDGDGRSRPTEQTSPTRAVLTNPKEPDGTNAWAAYAVHRNADNLDGNASIDPLSVGQANLMSKTGDEKQAQAGANIPAPVASSSSNVPSRGQADQEQNSEPTEMTPLTRPGPSMAAATPRDAAPEQDMRHGWLREAIAAELPAVMNEQLGISVDEAHVSVGTPGHERKITHVARGTAPTDAVNKAQLDEAVARVDRDASAGIAAAMAVAGLPQPTLPGKSLATFAAATYRGQYGAALGISHVTPNNRWVFKLAANANGRGYFGAVASGGFQW